MDHPTYTPHPILLILRILRNPHTPHTPHPPHTRSPHPPHTPCLLPILPKLRRKLPNSPKLHDTPHHHTPHSRLLSPHTPHTDPPGTFLPPCLAFHTNNPRGEGDADGEYGPGTRGVWGGGQLKVE